MKTVQSSAKLKSALFEFKRKKKSIGFVPTMGYLHEGHLSLVRRCRKESKVTVVSIFVNPLQFGPKEDYWRYPRNLARDARLLEREKVDFLFTPTSKEFYPEDFQTSVSVKRLSGPLCGASRPTHFAGVATVVLKLLNVVSPDVMYLGQKDYQQCRVIEQMVKDLDVPARVQIAPIIREPDGLAMSSRNVLLAPAERRQAPFLHRALQRVQELSKAGVRHAEPLKKAVFGILGTAPSAKIDYVEIVDAETLEAVVELKKGRLYVAAAAVFFGKTRLIDNVLIAG